MKNQHGIYLLSAVFLAVIILMVVFLAWPEFDSIRSSYQHILSYRQGVVSLDARSAQLAAFKKEYAGYESNLKKLDQLFVDSKNPIDFIEFLEKTATDAGISVQVSLSSDVPDKSGLPTQGFTVFAKGSFSDIMRFTRDMEYGPYLVNVQKASFQQGNVGGAAGNAPAAAGSVSADIAASVVIK